MWARQASAGKGAKTLVKEQHHFIDTDPQIAAKLQAAEGLKQLRGLLIAKLRLVDGAAKERRRTHWSTWPLAVLQASDNEARARVHKSIARSRVSIVVFNRGWQGWQ